MSKTQNLGIKKQLKMNLRDHSHIKPKKNIQYNQEEQDKHIQSKSRRWWDRINRRYFSPIAKSQLHQRKTTIVEDLQLGGQLLSFKQQSFFSKNLFAKNSKLFQRKNIKILFRNPESTDGLGSFIFMSYFFANQQNSPQEVQQQFLQYELLQKIQAPLQNGLKEDQHNTLKQDQPNQLTHNQQNGLKQDQQNELKQDQQNGLKQYQQNGYALDNSIAITALRSEVDQIQLQQSSIQQMSQGINLICNKSSLDLNFLNHCLMYDLTKDKYFQSELDRQINLWQDQLIKTENDNNKIWSQIFRNYAYQTQYEQNQPMNIKIQNGYNMEQDKQTIDSFLNWQYNLINIKTGYADKNQQMLAEALQGMWNKEHTTMNTGQKRKFFKASTFATLILTKSQLKTTFQTDCKICFSTFVSQKNKVFYCDDCNQSFHQHCYGIQNVDEDPNAKFFCDACIYRKQEKKTKKSQIACQICFVNFSPLKRFGCYFFHPSCLFFSNMIKPRQGQLKLKDQWSQQLIIENTKRIQSQLQKKDCQYCAQTCLKGLRYKCSEQYCDKYFHSICAYLNSAVFTIWRNNSNLQIKIKCSQHDVQRDINRQAYLRRFFCNYKNIADLTEDQFIQIYKEEIDQIAEYKRQRLHKPTKIQHRRHKVRKNKTDSKSSTQSCYIILCSDQEQQKTQSKNCKVAKTQVHTKIQESSSCMSAKQLKEQFQLLQQCTKMPKPYDRHVLEEQNLKKIQLCLNLVTKDSDFLDYYLSELNEQKHLYEKPYKSDILQDLIFK